MTVKLLAEHHFEYLSLTGGCKGSSESNHVKIPHCWKPHVAAHMYIVAHNIMIYNLKYAVFSLLSIGHRYHPEVS